MCRLRGAGLGEPGCEEAAPGAALEAPGCDGSPWGADSRVCGGPPGAGLGEPGSEEARGVRAWESLGVRRAVGCGPGRAWA